VSYYLGIDGGGTKTTCALGDDAHVLARVTSGPSNIVRVGEPMTRESLQQCVKQACAAAGISPLQVVRTCVGGSGAARPELAEKVRGMLAEILSSPVAVVGDMETALEAAFGVGPGVIVIAGTGSIAYGRNRKGRTARAGGWGFAVGDEGSAHWIGRTAVSLVLRTADENSSGPEDSSLAAALFKAWNVASYLDLARMGNAVPPPDFAALLPAVVSSQDLLAQRVLGNAGRELARTAGVVIRRLFTVDEEDVPVGMTGGVFRHAQLVRESFYNELRQLDARVQMGPNVVDPVEGALSMARRAARAEGTR